LKFNLPNPFGELTNRQIVAQDAWTPKTSRRRLRPPAREHVGATLKSQPAVNAKYILKIYKSETLIMHSDPQEHLRC